MTKQPIIIIGMHRSGTSLVTRLLEALGLFVGVWKDENHESFFFMQLNQSLLNQAGGSWDNPQPVQWLLDHSAARRRTVEGLRGLLNSPRVVLYTGPTGLVLGQRPLAATAPWGWKDPRNTYTLPLWLDLFPEARVVHVKRHGVDVARSLQVRGERYLEQPVPGPRRFLESFRARPPRFFQTARCLDLDEGMALWGEYTRTAEQHADALGERCLSFRYEDLLSAPRPHAERLARHCGLHVTDEVIGQAIEGVNADRALAHRKDPALLEVAKRHAPMLSTMGYE